MRAAAVRQPFFSCARQGTLPADMMLIPVKESPYRSSDLYFRICGKSPCKTFQPAQNQRHNIAGIRKFSRLTIQAAGCIVQIDKKIKNMQKRYANRR